MASGVTDSSLKYHLENAKAHGVTKAEIAAVITHTAFYAGWPKGWAVFNLAKEVWCENSSDADEKTTHAARCTGMVRLRTAGSHILQLKYRVRTLPTSGRSRWRIWYIVSVNQFMLWEI